MLVFFHLFRFIAIYDNRYKQGEIPDNIFKHIFSLFKKERRGGLARLLRWFPDRAVWVRALGPRTLPLLSKTLYVRAHSAFLRPGLNLKERRHRSSILKQLAKLFKIVISNQFQSSPTSAIFVTFCLRINPLVFFCLSIVWCLFCLSKPLFEPLEPHLNCNLGRRRNGSKYRWSNN